MTSRVHDESTSPRPCGCDAPARVVWREAGHVGWRCPCGLVYLDPMPRWSAQVADGHVDAFYELSTERRASWFTRWCPRGRVLEVGPGAGHLMEALRRRGLDVSGVDPNPASVRRIGERLGIAVELATIETSGAPDGWFDGVVHVDLLSHVEEPVRALRAMARTLAAGGHVCFEVGLIGGLAPAWYHVMGRVGFPQHRWLFSDEALRRVLARAGLRVVGLQRFGLVPSLAGIVARRLAGPLGEHIAGRRPDPGGLPAIASAPHRLYERALSFLRYPVGRFAPDVGPQTVFVAARRAGAAA
jgi:SAM-dependent methyltransferase